MNKAAIAFLLRAKKAACVGNGESTSSRPDSHDLHYAEGAFSYEDSRFGGRKFAGEELLRENGTPLWSMNYVGRTLSEDFSADFLREALSAAAEDFPYRGPQRYESGPSAYQCNVKGDPEWFYGYETISYHSALVYEYAFHGGLIG